MATPTPNPLYFACFPLQEYFVNKDTGFPLAGGYVQFFSDPAFTVPKDVYKQSLVNNTWDYTNLGSTLVLSSVGTFIDDTGDDIIPFLYPYDAQGKVELYFVRVWSGDPSVQGSVLQFTRQGWPPNLIQSTSPSDVFESSLNLFTNPQFSIVNFVNTVGQTYYEITVSGAGSVEIAPGWSIFYAGTGSLKLSQGVISSDVTTNPSYYLQIDSDAGVTPIKLIQRLSYSPRVFENNYLSVAVLANCTDNIAETITIDYTTSSGSSKQVLAGQVSNNNQFTLLAGVAGAPVLIDVTNNVSPETGYIDMVINVPSNRTLQFTSVFGVTVQNATSLVSSVQSTDAQQTNATFWYYKPELEYKPIPSYTLGWNWTTNPCQELGTTVAAASNTPGLSRYVADETIIFQNVNSSIACAFNNAGMGITPSADTSFAIVKYFSGAEVQNILSTPLCVQLKAGGALASTVDVIANVSIWYTFDANLPDLKASNYYSLVSAVDNTTGVATVGGGGVHGTWYQVPRSGLGAATANLKTANVPVYNFNGWEYNDATPATSVKYCAILISVSKLTAGVGCTFEYCTLQNGYISTRPQASSFGENLTALQQYYEKSMPVSVLPSASTDAGALIQQLSGQMIYTEFFGGNNNSKLVLNNSSFGLRYVVNKNSNSPIVTIYNNAGTANNVYATGYNQGALVVNGNVGIGTWTQNGLSSTGVNYIAPALGPLYSVTYGASPPNATINGYLKYHYTADARLGIA